MPKKQSYVKKTDLKGQKPWLKKVSASDYKIETVLPNKTILIVCEGQTEELYFKSFLVSTLKVKLFSLGQSKLQLVENANKIQQIEQCDEVWCVFDLDINLVIALNIIAINTVSKKVAWFVRFILKRKN